MEETIIKWSSKKIILSLLLDLLEVTLLIWSLSFLLSYPEETPMGLVALILFVGFLIIVVSLILYQRLRLLFSDVAYRKNLEPYILNTLYLIEESVSVHTRAIQQ